MLGIDSWLDFVQGAISLSRQLDYFREYQSRVGASAGGQRAAALTSGSIFLVSAGTSDYLQNYYVNPVLGATYTPDQFSDGLMQPFTSFVEVCIIAMTTRLSYESTMFSSTETSNDIRPETQLRKPRVVLLVKQIPASVNDRILLLVIII